MRLPLTALAVLSAVALADAVPAAELFSCAFANGRKAVDIRLDGTTVHYQFGRIGKAPDLVLERSVRRTGMTPWNGVGSSIWNEMSLDNGNVTYLASAWVDRRAGEDVQQQGALLVMEGEKRLAELACDAGTVGGDLDLLFDAKESAGQFWCFQTIDWRDAPCDG